MTLPDSLRRPCSPFGLDESIKVHGKTEHDDDIALGNVDAFFKNVSGNEKIDVIGPETPQHFLLRLAHGFLFLRGKGNVGGR